MKRGIFITGTDTGVGKTLVAGAIADGLRKKGVSVGVYKPVVSGCSKQNGRWIAEDTLFLKKCARVTDSPEEISPFCFRYPLAPMVAAEKEKRKISFREIRYGLSRIQKKYDFVIVEGVGGLMVPVAPSKTVVDLIAMCGYPVLVVGRLGLGTLNHTLLTLSELKKSGLKVAGVVLNQNLNNQGKGPAEKTNQKVLQSMVKVPVWSPFPYLKESSVEKGKARFDSPALKTFFRRSGCLEKVVSL